jgi:hypothetical protein
MISTSDVLEVMAVVAACHHRTAPRMDDQVATIETAKIWAKLFNAHNLSRAELVKAVEIRAAAGHVDAPEPAELITIARAERRRLDAETGPTPEYEALCESKAEDADELAEQRRIRELSPASERPKLRELVASIANQKGLAE